MGIKRAEMTSADKQRGVALLFVLSMFAVITSIAVTVVTQLHRNTEKQYDFLQHQQVKYYAQGAEQYAIALLRDKPVQRDSVTHWFETWADDHQLEMEGGQVEIEIIDEQALLNLNSLHGKNSEYRVDMLKRLLTQLEMNPLLTEKVHRWGNSDPQTLMEENQYYGSLESPILASGVSLSDVSEIKLMQILSDEEYKKLRPFVTILPDKAGINLNTVPRELLPMIFDGFSSTEAEEFVSLRGETGFQNINEIKQLPMMKNKNINWNKLQLTLSSQFFSVYIKAVYNDTIYYLHTLLAKNDQGDVAVIRRNEGDYPQWISILRRSVRDQ